MSAPRTLWTDDLQRRFYLVPDEVTLAEGDLRLRSGAARRISVSAAAAAPYEVPRDEARAFLDAKLDGFVAGAKQSVTEVLSKLGIPSPGATAAASPAEPAAAADAGAPGPGAELFAALTGESADQVGDPDVFLRALRTLGEQAAEIAKGSMGGPDEQAAARAQLRQLGDILRAHGIALPEPAPPPAANPGPQAPPSSS